MFTAAANHDTFDELRKIRKGGDRSVGTGVIRIESWFLKQLQHM